MVILRQICHGYFPDRSKLDGYEPPSNGNDFQVVSDEQF
jgi:hypothetical protein